MIPRTLVRGIHHFLSVAYDGIFAGEGQMYTKIAKKLLTTAVCGAILHVIENCESIEVRCASVFLAIGIGFPVGKKGQTAEVFFDSRSKDAGPMENIPRTVTKVERYHSSSLHLFVPCRECWSLPGFAVFCLRKERTKRK